MQRNVEKDCRNCRIENRLEEEPAAILLTSDQISPVITGDPNSFLSVFGEVLLL